PTPTSPAQGNIRSAAGSPWPSYSRRRPTISTTTSVSSTPSAPTWASPCRRATPAKPWGSEPGGKEGRLMQRLFSGTPWDRPPSCERCGRPESECSCPPVVAEPVRLDPATQTARLRVEKRAKGKVVTVVAGLNPSGNDLPALASLL